MPATTAKFDWKTLSDSSVTTVPADRLPKSVELPALPHAVTEFVQKSSNPNYDASDLARTVEKDSALTVELLKFVNSAAFSVKHQIRSVKDAIVHIGVNSARAHLLAVGMKAATRALRTKLLNQRNFWNESLQKALFAREVARRMELDSGLAFLGGLLQDFLLPVLTNTFDRQYIAFMERYATEGKDLVEMEHECFGWDHASAGAYFASQWHFPDDLRCAIFYHHSLSMTLADPNGELFQLFPVALASLLPDQLHQSPEGFRTLIRVARQSRSLDLESICRTVDADQMKLAEGYEIPNHLTELLVHTERSMFAANV